MPTKTMTPFEQLQAARTRFDTSRELVTGGDANDAVVAADAEVSTMTTALNVAKQTATDARASSKDVLVELHAAGQAGEGRHRRRARQSPASYRVKKHPGLKRSSNDL